MSFSQIAIASLMAGAPIHPAIAPDSVQAVVDTHPTPAVQLEYQLPFNGQDFAASGSEQPIEKAEQQAAESNNASGSFAVSPDDGIESPDLDSPPGSLPSTSETPANGQPPADDSIITVTARPETPTDPLMELNADSFDVVQDVDRAIVEPIAMAYKKVVPAPLRSGLRNFLRNLGEPVAFLNFLLQLKPGKAFETLGRFTINTTIGVGGLFDQAKKPPFYLPHRSNGFANTFGYYGIEPGAFLFLPLAGPTTVRDLVGNTLNLLFLPTVVGKPFTERALTVPGSILSALDSRIEFDEQIESFRSGTADPYTATREFYLNKRQTEIDILRGRIPDPLSRKSRGIEPAATPETAPEPTPSSIGPVAPVGDFDLPGPVAEPAAEPAPLPVDPAI